MQNPGKSLFQPPPAVTKSTREISCTLRNVRMDENRKKKIVIVFTEELLFFEILFH